MTTFVHSFCSRHVICINAAEFDTIGDLKAHLSETKGFPTTACFFICDGKIVEDDEPVLQGLIYHTFPRILGGKGGFGSMLRAIGAQIEKTTNREALRDLSGRRMRDVNNEKALKEWISKQADKEKERDEKRQERIARRRAMPNHKFDDPEYDKQKSTLAENQDDAFQEGLKKMIPGASATMTYEDSGSEQKTMKRKCDLAGPSTSKVRKATEWLGIDVDDLDMDSDDSGGGEGSPTEHHTIVPETPGDDDSSSTNDSMAAQMEDPTADIVAHVDMENTTVSIKSESTSKDSDCKCVNEDGETSAMNARCDDSTVTPTDSISTDREESIDSSGIHEKAATDTSDSTVCTIKTDIESKDSVAVKGEVKKEETTGEHELGENEAESCSSVAIDQTSIKQEPFNLDSAGSLAELLALGLDTLKAELMCRGLKCGGTLEQRAERLFSVKGLKAEEIDTSLLAKSFSGKRGKKSKT